MPTYQKTHRLVVILYNCGMGVLVAGMVAHLTVAPWGIEPGIALWILLATTIAVTIFSYVLGRNIRRRLRTEHALICPTCEYSLTGVPEPGPCPECGREFHTQKLRDHWEALNLFKPQDE